jgi:hypothetical protein
MNHTILLVKIVTPPIKSSFKDGFYVTEMQVKFVPIKTKLNSNDVIHLSIWDNLSSDTVKYYKVNEYIIIEGYISIRENLFNLSNYSNSNQISISVTNLYPIFQKSFFNTL